ncbi:MAG: hypothetical protein JW832_13830 [Deltaproteobacteria bacterium]|nr:hypothetical protein [Deltaproteobacteria bacterium]
MSRKSLPEACFEILTQQVRLDRIPGFDDLEQVTLLSGADGGGLKIYRGDKINRVVLVDFKLGEGEPVPHHENRPSVGAEIFQIAPDFNYKLPVFGINSVIMKDGTYYFDTDFSFGFDLVRDYDFVTKYIEPMQELYAQFSLHPDFKIIPLAEMTTWVRTYISPLFITAITTVDKIQTVFDLASEYIHLWTKMHRDAAPVTGDIRELQQSRIQAQYAGMKSTDRMGKVLLNAFGKDTFSKFFKAMS